MASRYTQLLQLLEDAKIKGDTDQVDILEQELYTMKNKNKGGEIKVKSGGYISDLL
jgi:U3 small nucleolar ribonucleoprotein component